MRKNWLEIFKLDLLAVKFLLINVGLQGVVGCLKNAVCIQSTIYSCWFTWF